MPSSGAFARVGLGAAVAVVIGISTFGPLLKQLTPTQGATGLVAGVAPVPSDNPPPLSGRALTDAVAGVMSSPVAASASNRTEVPARAVPQTEPPTNGIAAPAIAAVSASATSVSAFPPMQTMTDEGSGRAGEPTAQPTPPTASASGRPRGAEKSSAQKRVADAKKKRQEHPRPFGIREFLAGRW